MLHFRLQNSYRVGSISCRLQLLAPLHTRDGGIVVVWWSAQSKKIYYLRLSLAHTTGAHCTHCILFLPIASPPSPRVPSPRHHCDANSAAPPDFCVLFQRARALCAVLCQIIFHWVNQNRKETQERREKAKSQFLSFVCTSYIFAWSCECQRRKKQKSLRNVFLARRMKTIIIRKTKKQREGKNGFSWKW